MESADEHVPLARRALGRARGRRGGVRRAWRKRRGGRMAQDRRAISVDPRDRGAGRAPTRRARTGVAVPRRGACFRSEEHTSELQSLMRISYAVFCLKKKNIKITS